MDTSVITFAGTDRDAYKLMHKHQQCKFGRRGVLVGKSKPCNIRCHPFNTSTCFTVWLSTAFSNAFLSQSSKQLLCSSLCWKLLNMCHFWRICLGKWLLSMLCPLLLFRETCRWISEGSQSTSHYLLPVWNFMPNLVDNIDRRIFTKTENPTN